MTDLQAHPAGDGLGGLLSDASLAEQAAGGDRGAFDELYRRHVEAAWRVAQAVTGNRDDAADAVSEAFTKVLQALRAGRLTSAARFRPYLLQATRNAGIDVLRRTGRLRPTDSMDHLDGPAPAPGPGDVFLQAVDSSLVAAAFRSLPERWRAALWLTEVEGLPPSEAGPLLGVSANGAAQLAVRARAGLRDRYLQAHIGSDVGRSCRFTVEHLGAYVGGGLAPRDVAKVDQHLAGCEPCRDRLTDIEDLGSTLRRIALPLPLAMAGVAAAKWKLAFAGAAAVKAASTGGAKAALSGITSKAAKPLAAVSGGLLAISLAAVPLVNRPGTKLQPPQAAAAPPPFRTSHTQPAPSTTSSTSTSVPGGPRPDGLAASDDSFAFGPAGVTTTTALADTSGPLADSTASTTTTTAPDGSGSAAQPAPVVQVTVPVTVPGSGLPVTISVGVGDGSCTGADVNGTVIGCDPSTAPSTTTTSTTLPVTLPSGEILPQLHLP
jgi:RNA polymerase sigma factor (sigma-70 family)